MKNDKYSLLKSTGIILRTLNYFKILPILNPLKWDAVYHLQPINEYCRDEQYTKQGLNKKKIIIPFTIVWILNGIQSMCLNVIQVMRLSVISN